MIGTRERRAAATRGQGGTRNPDPGPSPFVRIAAARRPGQLFLLALALLTLAAPLLGDPFALDLARTLEPPSGRHLLGTDETGRDVLARLVHGGRVSLGIGLAGAALAVAVGAVLGGLSGYLGGVVDALIMRLVDFGLAFPSIFLILFFTAIFSSGVGPLIVLIGLTGWMPVARLTRGVVREIALAPYVEAARALGANSARIIAGHCLPNALGVLFVAALAQVNRAILAETTISFLGLGVKPPIPSWGNLLTDAQNQLWTAPWLAIAPGLAITATLLAIYSLGAGRDA